MILMIDAVARFFSFDLFTLPPAERAARRATGVTSHSFALM
jgi:hypothetical protein